MDQLSVFYVEGYKLSLVKRIKRRPFARLRLQLSGYVYVGGPPPYAFQCPAHGMVESYPHGYEQRLECPLCMEEKAASKAEA